MAYVGIVFLKGSSGDKERVSAAKILFFLGILQIEMVKKNILFVLVRTYWQIRGF